ncbi:MAG: hypothetical protein WC285_04710 [Candidatus Gracilibacteria bacterium]
MKKVFIALGVVVVVLVVGIFAYLKLVPGWPTYENSRYGFSVKYPVGWTLLDAPTNSDGRSLVSPGELISCQVYGFENVLPGTAGEPQSLNEFVSWLTETGVIGGVSAVSDATMAGYPAKELIGSDETGVSQAVYILGKESGRGLVCYYSNVEARESFSSDFERMKESFKVKASL